MNVGGELHRSEGESFEVAKTSDAPERVDSGRTTP
jgi:hypothetical protein